MTSAPTVYDRPLSHSALSDFLSCGEKFRLRRIVEVPRTPSWALVAGRAVHNCTQNLDLADFGVTENLGPLRFLDAFLSEIEDQKQWTNVPVDQWKASGRATKEWPNKEDYQWWLAHGQAQVDAWRRFLTISPYQIWVTPDGDPAIELALEWNIGDVPVRGIIDRVVEDTRSGQLVVVDLKSGSRVPVATDQLEEYGHGLSSLYGEDFPDQYYGCYFMTRKAETTVPVDISVAKDGRLEYIFGTVRKSINEGRFVPNVGQGCFMCDAKPWCYAMHGPDAASVSPYKSSEKESA